MSTLATPSAPEPEIVIVDSHRVKCDGDDSALGHPRVFLEMGGEDFVECPYCDRRFVMRGSAHDPNA
ncbi:zinc-finger domain-containing protein [Woodsholea maritima]|uniref:zinc-finger domain-containing protein n=1 Tax=Woodsholea maritima TaxID=240237 RepID=UPI00036B68A9|nr:zinc-finger domain-containing protein [Woodsholea maritima]